MVNGRVPACGRTISIRRTGCRYHSAARLNVRGPRWAVTRICWRDFKNPCRSHRSCHLSDTLRNEMANVLTCVQNARSIQMASHKSLRGTQARCCRFRQLRIANWKWTADVGTLHVVVVRVSYQEQPLKTVTRITESRRAGLRAAGREGARMWRAVGERVLLWKTTT